MYEPKETICKGKQQGGLFVRFVLYKCNKYNILINRLSEYNQNMIQINTKKLKSII